ncbi:MAG: hypothetical protein RI909_1462 [Bacteroidota bacterium]
MKYIIESSTKEVSLEREEIIKKKFQRFEKKLQGLIRCDIKLKKEKNDEQNAYIVEGRLHISGNDLFAKEQASSYELAAENVCIDLENQIRKQKEKKNKKAIKPIDQLVNDEELE